MKDVFSQKVSKYMWLPFIITIDYSFFLFCPFGFFFFGKKTNIFIVNTLEGLLKAMQKLYVLDLNIKGFSPN